MRRYIFISVAIAVGLLGTVALAQFGGGYKGPRGGEAAFTAESPPGTNPTATGTDAIGIGDGAVAGDAAADDGVLAIGARSTATGDGAIAIGENTDATGANSIAIGGNTTDASSADATGVNSVAIGNNSLADGNNTTALGERADAGGGEATALGRTSSAAGNGSVAIGNGSSASGVQSVAIGTLSVASGEDSFALGDRTDATADRCIAIGGNSTDTDSADCSAVDSVALGQRILADDIGEFAFASGEFAAQSDAHTSIFVLRNSATDATQTELFADGSAGDISVPSDCTIAFRINVVGRRTDADDESAAYFFEGAIDNNAGTTALVGAIGKVIIAEDTAAWDVTVTADDTNDGINVLVTGEAAKTIRWVARAEITEVCG